MPLLALLTRETGMSRAVESALPPGRDTVVSTASWAGLERLLVGRPVTGLLLDVSALSRSALAQGDPLRPLRRGFPNTWIVLLAGASCDPPALFDLGRSGARHLVLRSQEGWEGDLVRALSLAREDGAAALVTRAMAPYLPVRALGVLRTALDSVDRRPTAESFAMEVGLCRPFLSECLKEVGLPSAGHLLLWARLLQAGHWLEEPARSAESVSRQLEYSSGAAFRRALKLYTGATPTQVIASGGLAFVLRAFLRHCFLRGRDLPPVEAVA